MKILLVAYYFPPASDSGAFRPLFFANHLTELGDEITVLTSRKEDYLADQPIDEELLARLNHRVRVVRSVFYRPIKYYFRVKSMLPSRSVGNPVVFGNTTNIVGNTMRWIKAIKYFVGNLIATPDAFVGWIPSSIRQGLAIIRDLKQDVIIATGGPWSGLLVGSILKQLTGVPLVVDFRDPWIANPGYMRFGLFRKIDTWLEKYVVGSADLLIANTEELRQDFLYRYKYLVSEQVVTIPNGFESYLPTCSWEKNKAITLTHAGTLYLSRNPQLLLEALRDVIEQGKIDRTRIKLRFIGDFHTDTHIVKIMASPSLADNIEVIPQVSYEESLEAIGKSDVLILYQPGFPLQVPRKLYDYMAARRPILCIAELGSATWSLVERYSLGITCENKIGQLKSALVMLYDQWQNGRLDCFTDNRCEAFQNHNLAMQLQNYLKERLNTSSTNQDSTLL